MKNGLHVVSYFAPFSGVIVYYKGGLFLSPLIEGAKLVRAKHNLDIFQFYLLMSDSIQMLF